MQWKCRGKKDFLPIVSQNFNPGRHLLVHILRLEHQNNVLNINNLTLGQRQ